MKKTSITASDFDKKFNSGEDISTYFDLNGNSADTLFDIIIPFNIRFTYRFLAPLLRIVLPCGCFFNVSFLKQLADKFLYSIIIAGRDPLNDYHLPWRC